MIFKTHQESHKSFTQPPSDQQSHLSLYPLAFIRQTISTHNQYTTNNNQYTINNKSTTIGNRQEEKKNMTTPHDDPFSFDLSPQSTTLTIDQLCAQLATSYDELLLSFQLMVTYLTAYSTTCADSVPNPADPLRSVMNNPFVLVQAPVTSTTVLAQESNATRRVKVTDTFQLDYQRSYGSYVQARDALRHLITQLHQSFPVTSSPSGMTTQPQSSGCATAGLDLSDVNIHNIESLSRINVITLITQNIPLRSEQDFPNEEAYINYLRETKRVLYHRVKKQLEVIEHLKQQAVSLQSTLTLYRARWVMIFILILSLISFVVYVYVSVYVFHTKMACNTKITIIKPSCYHNTLYSYRFTGAPLKVRIEF